MERGYRDGTNSEEDNLRVAGQYRLKLVHEILSKNLIEQKGIIAAADSTWATDILAQRLCKTTNFDADIVEATVASFIDQGLVRTRQAGNTIEWYWNETASVV